MAATDFGSAGGHRTRGRLVAYATLLDRQLYLAPLILIAMAMMLTALPLLICYVQTISLQRQLAKLDTLNDRTVSNTAFFKIAYGSLQSINPAPLDKYYAMPILTFAFVIIFCWLMTNAVYFKLEYFTLPNVVLGGFHVLDPKNDDLALYQRGTFVAGCFGFIGAYIYTNWRLLDRINNNDIYPISFYYYSARMLAACLIAGISYGAHQQFTFRARPDEEKPCATRSSSLAL